MVVLTRAAAKKANATTKAIATAALARQYASYNTVATVSPSATGQGRHTRWNYPPHCISQFSTASDTLWSDSMSSLSTLSDSSFESSQSSSLETQEPVALFKTLCNDEGISSKVQVNEEETTARVTLISDSFTEEAVGKRETEQTLRACDIFHTQFFLMKEREAGAGLLGLPGLGSSGDYSDDESEAGTDTDRDTDTDTDVDMDSGKEEDEKPLAPRDAFRGPKPTPHGFTAKAPRRGQPLGPHGTELIDSEPSTNSSSQPKLLGPSPRMANPSTVTPTALTRQATEIIIT